MANITKKVVVNFFLRKTNLSFKNVTPFTSLYSLKSVNSFKVINHFMTCVEVTELRQITAPNWSFEFVEAASE